MPDRSAIRCQTDGCPNTLGSWAIGQYFPAAHLIGGRDLWLDARGRLYVRCSMCNTWYVIEGTPQRLKLVVAGGR